MDTMEFKATVGGMPAKVTGNSNEEILERWMTLIKGIEPDNEETRLFWLNRIKSNATKYTKEQIMKRRAPRLTEVWHAGVALFNQAQGKTVSQEEYDRRSKICAGCDFKTEVSFCRACGGGNKLTNLINNFRKKNKIAISLDKRTKDNYCKACGCSLTLLCLTQSSKLPVETDEENAARPKKCWMRKSGINYIP